jgi:acyl-CoA thioesterase FadM
MTDFPIQIRPSDCDSYGHVNNAIYVSYFQQALADGLTRRGCGNDWRTEGEYRWEPQTLHLEYRRPATYGENLEARLWLAQPDRIHPGFGFDLRSNPAAGGDPAPVVFRALGIWTRKQRKNDALCEINREVLEDFSSESGALPRGFEAPAAIASAREYRRERIVELGEVDPTGFVHPQALFQWFEESIHDASAQAGWPLARWLAAGVFTLQTRHDAEIFTLPRGGDTVQIASRLIDARRLGGTWLIEVHRSSNHQLLARDFSTGVHLNLEGRPTAPPAQIIQDIQNG